MFFFFLFGQILFSFTHMFAVRHEKSLVPGLFSSLLITYFDNLESGKRKSLKKSWILDPKICMNPVGNSSSLQLHSFAEINIVMCELDYEKSPIFPQG